MTLFDQLKSVAADWLKRRDTQDKLESLMEMVAKTNAAVSGTESPFLALAMERLEKAEAARQKAVGYFEQDDVADCEKRCERGLMHLMIASLHLSANASHKLEIVFDDESAEYAVEQLSSSIAKFKMAVEYSNCTVTEKVKVRWWDVAAKFPDALSLLKNGREEEAKRTAEACLLNLHYLGKVLEQDNLKGIIELDPTTRASSKEMLMIKGLTEQISQTQCLLSVSHTRGYRRVERYLEAALENLEKALDAYADGDDGTVRRMVAAGMMEARMASEICKSGTTTDMAFNPQEPAEAVPDEAGEFCRRLVQVSRLIKDYAPESERMLNRLDAVNYYYRKCMNALIAGDYKEAERSARAAHLDLDFAKQLFSGQNPIYSTEL